MFGRRSQTSLLAAALITGGLTAETAAAADLQYDFSLRHPHVWRGITLREFPVLSAALTARRDRGFTTHVWIGFDLADDNGREGEIQEIDLDLSKTWTGDRASWTVGFAEFIFPGGIDNTGELYARWWSHGRWSPRLEVYYNVDLLRDVYAQASVSRSWPRTPADRPQSGEGRWTPTVTATVAYGGEEFARFFGGRRGGLHHWSLRLDLDLPRGNRRWKGRVGYSDHFDESVLPRQSSRLWGGLYLTLRPP